MNGPTWTSYTEGMRDDDLEMLTRWRAMAKSHSGVTEKVTKSGISLSRTRIFTSAYVKSHYLEVAVDLLEEAEHPQLRTSFHTTKKVITHRLTFSSAEQIDEKLAALVKRAYDEVGPGFRKG